MGKKKVLIVGSGAGGAAAARDLQGAFDVTVLEEGRAFQPFTVPVPLLGRLRKTGLFLDEREIELLFPAMRVMKTREKMVLIRGRGLGGTTTLSAGNALRQDESLKNLGINLDREFQELSAAIPISEDHQSHWRDTTRSLYRICEEMELHPFAIPKLGDYSRCRDCGQCVLGCRYGAKWDSRQFLQEAGSKGAELKTGSRVTRVVIREGRARGVMVRAGMRTYFQPADIVVLAAGGFATPVLLQKSGIPVQERLFVDPVLCVAAVLPGSRQNCELSMPFGVASEHYLLSPYFDFLSFFFNKKWHYPAENIAALMIKLADSNEGSISRHGVHKPLTPADQEHLKSGIRLAREIWRRMGIPGEKTFLGTLNAGHPGGMLPLTAADAASLHPSVLPPNLYVADASLFPRSLGNPPILTIMALAKAVSYKIINQDV